MEYKKINELCVPFSSNISINKLEANIGEYPLYGAAGFVKNIDFFQADKPYISIIKDGAGVGRIAIHKGKSSIVGTMQGIYPKENINIKWLYYVLKNQQFDKNKTGATIPHIYFKDYGKNVVKVVEINEQMKIVECLENIECQIMLKQKQLIKLDELIQSRFIEMFGDVQGTIDFNDVIVDETKKGFKFDSSFYMKTGEVAIVDQGKDLICGYKDKENDKPPYIKECIIFGDHTEIFKHIDFPIYLGADGTKILKVNDGWNTLYVYEYLKIFYMPIGGYSRHFKFLKEQLFSKPDIKMQNEFADFVKQINKSKFLIQKQINLLEELLENKMNEYFR